MFAVISAMDREIVALRRLLSNRQMGSFMDMNVIEGKLGKRNIVTATTGVGRGKSREIVDYLCANYKPDALVCSGYAGATSQKLNPGDLVVLSRVHLLQGNTFDNNLTGTLDNVESDLGLLTSARRIIGNSSIPAYEGEGVTVPNILRHPSLKQLLGERLRVSVVDMESYWVASASANNGVPFLGVRAVTDPVVLRIPEVATMIDEYGNSSIAKVLVNFLRKPSDIYPLLRIAGNARLATRHLTDFLVNFVSAY